MFNMTAPTFEQVFKEWYSYYDCITDVKTSRQTYQAICTKILPTIGHLPINEIKPKQILDLSNDIAKSSTYYARRLVQYIINIIDYAVIIMQVLDFNYIARLNNYLVEHKKVGRRFVEMSQVPVMLQDIQSKASSHDTIMRALWTLIYTGLRRSEVVLAKKNEFDLSKKVWTIPAERMKIMDNGNHIVPLSKQVIDLVLPLLNSNHSNEYVFASITKPNQAINAWSLYYPLIKSGWYDKQSLHGFRKIFSTHAHTSRLWTIDSIELSLAHKISGVRGIYNHANMLDERIELMAWWANQIDMWRGIK